MAFALERTQTWVQYSIGDPNAFQKTVQPSLTDSCIFCILLERQIGDAITVWSLMTTQITGKLLRDQVRMHREKRPERPFTTVEKILIAAEVVKRESQPKRGQNSAMNDADIVQACTELFWEYDGRDKDLYVRGKILTTMPMVRSTLVRDHLFGRAAPLKLWVTYNPKEHSYLLNAAGSVHVHKLLLGERGRKKRPLELVAAPTPAPIEMMLRPTPDQLRAIQRTCWGSQNLVKDLRKLECVRHPPICLTSDSDHLLRVIERHRQAGDPPIPTYLQQAVERTKTLVHAEALFKGTPEALAESVKESHSLDVLLILVQAVLKRSTPSTPLYQRFQKPRSRYVPTANA